MPSAIAHAAVGASLSLLSRGRVRPWIPLGLATLAILPDLDVIGFRFGVSYGDPLGHRGFSHSFFFAVLLGVASYPLWRRLDAKQALALTWLAIVATASHGLLDAFTDAGRGIGLLMPFDGGRYFAPWRPILTSPLSIRAFISGDGLAILANEAVWIGVPTAIFAMVAWIFRRRRRIS